MKKNIFTLLASAALLCACQPAQKETTISGTLTGIESDTLLVLNAPMPTASNENAKSKTDTIVMQEGKFTLTLACDSLPVQAVIFAKPSGNKALNMLQNIRIVAFPGDALTVSGSMDDYVVDGSDFYATLNEAQKNWETTNDSIKHIITAIGNAQTENQSADSIRLLTEQIQALGQRMIDQQIDYIRQHPDEDVSVYLLGNTGERLDEALTLIGDKAKNGALSGFYEYMDAWVKEAKAREEAQARIKEGAEAPDFTLNDLNGQPLLVRLVHQGHTRHEEVLREIQGQAGNPGHRLPRHGREVEGRCRETRTAVAARTQRRRPRCQCPLCHTGLSHQDCHRPRRQDCQDCRGRRPGFLSISGRTV